MSKEARKRQHGFTGEFKLSVLARLAETDSIVGLARELGLERKLLYCWRERAGGGKRLSPRPLCLGRTAQRTQSSELRPWSARLASNRWSWIFFAQPCSKSRHDAA